MKKSFLLLLLVISMSCSSRNAPQTDVTKRSGAKFSITAIPRQGFLPLHVSFHATLEGIDAKNKDFYCLQEQWDFGDGSISTEKPHCETFKEGSEVTTEFFADHTYDTAGSYSAFFSLGEEKNVVRSGRVQVVVIESMRGYSGR